MRTAKNEGKFPERNDGIPHSSELLKLRDIKHQKSFALVETGR